MNTPTVNLNIKGEKREFTLEEIQALRAEINKVLGEPQPIVIDRYPIEPSRPNPIWVIDPHIPQYGTPAITCSSDTRFATTN